MKIALCLSGHVRTYKKCEKSLFEKIIEPYNPDIFIHTWNDVGYGLNGVKSKFINKKTRKIIESNAKYGRSEIEFLRTNKKVTLDYFSNLNSKKIEIEDYQDVEKEILDLASTVVHKGPEDHPPNIVSLYRKIYLCNKLKTEYEDKNNFKYDVVIRSRPDIYYNNSIDFINLDALNTVKQSSFGMLSDIFYFSNSKNMDILSNLYKCMPEYIENKVRFNPHFLMQYHLIEEKIPFYINTLLDLFVIKTDKSPPNKFKNTVKKVLNFN